MGLGDGLRESWYYGNAKWYLLGGVGGIGFVLWYRHYQRNKTSGANTTQDGAILTAATDGLGQTPTTGSPGSSGGGDTSSSPGLPTTNAEWIKQAVAKLQQPPYNAEPVTLFNALTKALNGEPVTASEAILVGWAISVEGVPPGGAPTIVLIPATPPKPPPPTNPPPTAPPPTTPPPSKPPAGGGSTATKHTVQPGDTLTSIGAAWHTTALAVYNRNASVIDSEARKHGHPNANGPDGSKGWYIYPGTVLYKP